MTHNEKKNYNSNRKPKDSKDTCGEIHKIPVDWKLRKNRTQSYQVSTDQQKP